MRRPKSIIVPAVERFERLFAEKAVEAMELEAASLAWQRMNAMPAEIFEGESDVAKLLTETREKFLKRLELFAGRPEDAPETLDRLRDDLKNLAGVHAALLGVQEEQSWSILGTSTVKYLNPNNLENGIIPGFVDRDVQRVRALFSGLGVQLPGMAVYSGDYGFGVGGMGDGMMMGRGGQ